ncbi:DUF1501 domain-containing protein [Sphingomonas sanxanigenens]|uniref:DUF1501 domain-containing protein n=1 Tax=Sphingomonas sanxanigenens DSM 19645 = NX02 TaxID=1123269 RepID=W0A8U7_9SPHN|nr:DUF1501 domain-containing protein [Sphingomonas sanxanigenens]AHE53486.1 hypothetical protein NX02_08815 [Sphingomonas sanxanigenens DSM 19645 = NX02]
MFDRRRFLGVAALGAGSLFVAPHLALARVVSDRRFLFVIQRGAADGLNIVVPHGDPDYARLRGALAIDAAGAIKLDGQFSLHPSLAGVGKLYGEGQALFVQAVASPYRERSHFDGQNVLETGGARPYAVKDGWLNRLTGLLPKERDEAIAFAPTVPLALRGQTEVSSYAASNLPQASDDLLARVQQLYARDPMLHGLWSAAMEARGLAGDSGPKQDPASLGKLAATFLTQADGPRIAMIETGGWDTHSGQNGRLAGQLRQLDTLLGAFREGLGPVWNDTVVLVATEFGRTAAANGTGGTDHGTGSAAMLIGGAVKGGRVLADWPGLGQNALLDGRDLRPTTDLDALIAGCSAETFGLDPALVARTLAQTGRAVRPMEGLVRS